MKLWTARLLCGTELSKMDDGTTTEQTCDIMDHDRAEVAATSESGIKMAIREFHANTGYWHSEWSVNVATIAKMPLRELVVRLWEQQRYASDNPIRYTAKVVGKRVTLTKDET